MSKVYITDSLDEVSEFDDYSDDQEVVIQLGHLRRAKAHYDRFLALDDAIEAHDRKLDAEPDPKAPTGDDYNEVLELFRAASKEIQA